jgi:hypothetical protein
MSADIQWTVWHLADQRKRDVMPVILKTLLNTFFPFQMPANKGSRRDDE